MDSNHDNQLQRLVSYQLDDPGVVANTAFTSCRNYYATVNWVKTLFSRVFRIRGMFIDYDTRAAEAAVRLTTWF
jgi:hypothetical protein